MTDQPSAREMLELLPCPFCGSPGMIVKNGFPPRNRLRHPSCSKNGCIGYVVEQDEQGGTNVDCMTDEEAAKLWNTRLAAQSASAPERTALTDYIDDLERHGSIEHDVAFEIKKRLATPAPTFSDELLKADALPPEATFNNAPDMLNWLNETPTFTDKQGREVLDPLDDLVSRFAKALLAKLKLPRANGRSGWERDDWEAACQRGLNEHLAKGDPLDVAAYSAFLWHHRWTTVGPLTPTDVANVARLATLAAQPQAEW